LKKTKKDRGNIFLREDGACSYDNPAEKIRLLTRRNPNRRPHFLH
jgi:hypothetical protein